MKNSIAVMIITMKMAIAGMIIDEVSYDGKSITSMIIDEVSAKLNMVPVRTDTAL